jgi:hypothetical protein
VIAESKVELWAQDRKPEQMSRALLGDYVDAVVWQPAFEAFLDACAKGVLGPRASVLRGLEPKQFLPRTRGLAMKTFSMASKGVHHEFVLPHTSYYDDATVRVLVEDAVHTCADLGVVASCCEHMPFPLSREEALTIYEDIQ